MDLARLSAGNDVIICAGCDNVQRVRNEFVRGSGVRSWFDEFSLREPVSISLENASDALFRCAGVRLVDVALASASGGRLAAG
jgi:hypothetical protein